MPPITKPIKAALAAAALTAALAQTGCATIVSRSSYPVQIQSQPPGASFIALDKNGTPRGTGVTPQTAVLPAGMGPYTVNYTWPDGRAASARIGRSLDGWYFGNLLFGGPLGLLLVDPLSGSMFKLSQTAIASAPMQQQQFQQQFQRSRSSSSSSSSGSNHSQPSGSSLRSAKTHQPAQPTSHNRPAHRRA